MNHKLSAVNVASCHKISSTEPFILVIHKGESLVESLIKCAEIVQFPSASLSGLGALENPILGHYDFATQKHEHKKFPGFYEMSNLVGNITQHDGKYLAHIHVTLGDVHCHTISGHLIDAPIGVIAEITIKPFATPIEREFNPEFQIITIKT